MLLGNSDYRAEARKALSFNWMSSALTSLVYFIIIFAVAFVFFCVMPDTTEDPAMDITQDILITLVMIPLFWGYLVGFLNLIRGNSISFKCLFTIFRGNDFKRVFLTMLLSYIYMTLWSLLLVIPGCIKWYSYAMVPYILKDNPDMGYNLAIEKSMAMMKGHKMQLFLLDLSLIGWGFLAFITVIGWLWFLPYLYTAHAAMYENLKEEYEGAE